MNHKSRMTLAVHTAILFLAGSDAAHAQRSDVVGRTLREPTRTGPAPAPAPAGPQLVALAGATVPSTRWSLTPSARSSGTVRAFGAQVKAAGSLARRLPYSAAATYQTVRNDGNSQNRVQGDLELDIINNDVHVFGLPLFAAVFGTIQHTSDAGLFLEGAGEIDVTIFERGVRNASVGVIGYFDSFKPTSGERSSGGTVGLLASIVPMQRVGLNGEYDFKSDFNGEDSFSVRATWRLGAPADAPVLILGAAKHETFLLAMKLTLPRAGN